MYFEKYKACHTIFEGIPKLDIGGVHLRGLFPNKLELESKAYFINSSDFLLNKYLPEAYSSNEEEAKSKLYDYIKRFLLKACIPFVIATHERSIPIGYILCHSPLVTYTDSEEEINDWTIDFWLGESARGQKIMEPVLYKVLDYLKTKEVDRVYIYVDKHNSKSIHIIENCNFVQLGESGDGKLYKYGIRLKRNVSL